MKCDNIFSIITYIETVEFSLIIKKNFWWYNLPRNREGHILQERGEKMFFFDYTIIICTLLSVIVTITSQLMTIILKRKDTDWEIVISLKEIKQQGDRGKKQSKATKLLSDYVASMLAIIFISELSESLKKSNKRNDKNKLILSALFLEEKVKNIYKAYFTIVIGCVILILISIYFMVPPYISAIPLFFAIVVCSYHFLLNYRIKNGLFGTNDYEAKELLEFIIRNNDKINGNKLFNEEVISSTIVDFSDYVKRVRLLNEN
ncbi:hypothetical protein ABEW49_09450 [Bacillus anthracis]|uniref:hypothetical protein n=1 Tax=Bacillus anthracis TaxID=1392 RepID=UPI003D1D6A56